MPRSTGSAAPGPSGVPDVPDVPEAFDPPPRTRPWSAEKTMARVYHLDYPPLIFNPGKPGNPGKSEERTEPCGRFHFFDDDAGGRVPVLYAAEGQDAAISETVFHDLPVDPEYTGASNAAGAAPARAVVPESRLAAYGLVFLRPRRELTLIELHGHGLRRLGLRARNLTDTVPEEYPRTVRWARALHAAVPEADGLVWMSRQFNSEKAVVLFGNRTGQADLEIVVPGVPLRTGPGRAVVDRAANAAGVMIV